VDGAVILDENKPIFSIRDLSLKANAFHLLDIGILADHGSPFRNELIKYADVYGLQPIMSSASSVVMKPSARADRPSFKSKARDEGGLTLTVTTPDSGLYTVILAGENIRSRFAEARFIDGSDQQWNIRRDVFIGEVKLKAGQNDLRLVRHEKKTISDRPEETPFHFVAAIPQIKFDDSIRTLNEHTSRIGAKPGQDLGQPVTP
jgi:hypothetical protein